MIWYQLCAIYERRRSVAVCSVIAARASRRAVPSLERFVDLLSSQALRSVSSRSRERTFSFEGTGAIVDQGFEDLVLAFAAGEVVDQ